MLGLIVSVRIKPDRRDEFLKAIEEDGRGSREDEPGCLRFDVLQDAADPNHYFFYEIYRDEAALEAHRAAPHYQHWRAAIDAGVLDGPVEATRCQTVFPPDAHKQWQ
ncbi:MAG: antibiotic biosynthesis monooxygenase [Chloroflexota bacterium]|nr:antibiotic biosynthesis monooxygenase [Chloroflexota bacterium]